MGLTINQWIDKGKDLPVLSGSISEILKLADGTESDVNQISQIIKRDISLSASILRIANSSAFGLLRKVTSIDQAVMFLGFKSVRNIALGVGVFNLFPPQEKDFLSRIWRRSLVTALASRELCDLTGDKRKEDAFTIGLLHDIGFIAFYGYDKKKATELLQDMENNGRPDLEKEKEYMGLDHIEVGRLLAERWKLPEEIILSTIHHHDEPEKNPSENDNNEILSRVIYLASLVGDIFYLGGKTENLRKFNEACQALLGISHDDADHLLHNIHPQLTEVAEYFDIAIGSGNTYEEILSTINEEIINITISNEAIKHHLTKAFEREKALSAKLEEANRNLKMQASKDPLTGLFNRHFLNELLEKEWIRAKRHEYPLSIIMADMDDFKSINDNYGHQAGDMVLKKVAEILSNCLRGNDYLARYGGEEFLFLLPQTDSSNALVAADRVKTSVQRVIISLNKNKLPISISCGVSTALPAKGDDNIDALIDRADQALYEAKDLGKNRVASK